MIVRIRPLREGRSDEAITIYRRADYWGAAGGRGRREDGRLCPSAEATLYNWKVNYGDLEVSGVKRLLALEDESGRLKRLLADAMLDNAGMKDLL